MIRIIAGKYRRLNLEGPNDNSIRPTMDRAKEGLFNVINLDIEGATFLDLFSGTGSVAIEAISRGAASADIVEQNPKALSLIRKNLQKLEEEPIQIYQQDVFKYVDYCNNQYDFIFLDPPYDMEIEKISQLIKTIKENNLLTENGQIIFEFNTKKAIEIPGVEVIKFKKYGISGFTFYA